jgi:hypothetical protein
MRRITWIAGEKIDEEHADISCRRLQESEEEMIRESFLDDDELARLRTLGDPG